MKLAGAGGVSNTLLTFSSPEQGRGSKTMAVFFPLLTWGFNRVCYRDNGPETIPGGEADWGGKNTTLGKKVEGEIEEGRLPFLPSLYKTSLPLLFSCS